MKEITFKDLTRVPDAQILNKPKQNNLNLHGVSIDSRTIRPREIFWALKGDRYDGHKFVYDAIKKGAIAAVINNEYARKMSEFNIPLVVVPDSLHALQNLASMHRRKYRIPVIAITGTNGKTTTKEMIAWILQTKLNVHKTIGNLNNHIGTPLTLLGLTSDHQISVIELGANHPGEIGRLSSIANPKAAMVTNIGRGHLQFFSTIEGVAREKSELFNHLNRLGTVFLNRDDPLLPDFPRRRKTLWAFSLRGAKKSRVKGKFIQLADTGEGIWTLNNKVTIRMKVKGIHNVKNALAASTVALRFGFNEESIKEALEDYSPFEKRMQIIESGEMIIINDSYNANPESYEAALETLVHMSNKLGRRKIVVMGDMLELGLNSETLHQELLFSLLEYDVDGIFTLGATSQLAGNVLRDRGYDSIFSFTTHEHLAKELVKYLRKDDVVLLKGSRGMQMEKILGYI